MIARTPYEDLPQALVDDVFVQACWATAETMITDYIGDDVIPAEIIDRATLMVGSELYHQRNAPNGVAQFASYDGSPIRVARDPMVAAYPLLNRYKVVGF